MERFEQQAITKARETLPDGFVIIRTGSVRPDDMVFCWTSGEWLTADSPEWLQKTPPDVRDCVAVARRPGLDGFENATRRNYILTKTVGDRITFNKVLRSGTPKPALQDPQQLLF